MKKLWINSHIATMKNARYSCIENAAIITENEAIYWIGEEKHLPQIGCDEVIDLNGARVTPGLIDCHTHSVFGGNRSVEFEQRLQGVSYAEIAKNGSGIASNVNATRQATEEELYSSALKRINNFSREGVTTIEIKSGYGLDYKNERKMLKVIKRLAENLPLTVKSTCLAAHALPPEYQGRSDEYIDYICEEMLPKLNE